MCIKEKTFHIQAAFSDKVCIDEARLYMGEWGVTLSLSLR